MNHEEQFVFKQLDKNDVEEFDALLRYAFQVTASELKRTGWSDGEMRHSKQPVFDFSYVLGWFYKGHLASQIVIYPMEVNIQDKVLAVGGLTGVTTYPEYTGRGLAHALIKKGLEHMRQNQQSLCFLFPYSIPFYRKMGWEIVSDKMTFTIKDTQLPKKQPVTGMIERVPTEHEDIKRVYKYFSLQRHGALIRDDFMWEEYWRWDNDDIMAAIYYSHEDKPLGYLIYLIEDEVMHIKEMIYLNQEAKDGIWNYISAHFSMVTSVSGYNYTGDPIAFQFDDSEIIETIEPHIMARIVDVTAFMEHYPYQVIDEMVQFYFRVSDPLAPYNNGIFHLYFKEGKATCEHVATYRESHLVTLDIQTLTTMMLGYKRPTYLYDNGRMEIDYHLIPVLEMLIAPDKPYFSDYF